jgi:orotidine-5'-phosphate decarboxylase
MKKRHQKEAICIALDVPHEETALNLVDSLKDHVGFFKVGMQLFYQYGPSLVNQIRAKGVKIFLDLKFYDIPNTVKNAVIASVRMNVNMINVHASGGLAMMQQAVEGAKEIAYKENRPIPDILGVTILTSMTQDTLTHELHWPGTIKTKVCELAQLSKKAGLDGVVASPLEVEWIRAVCGKDFKIITPGIRPIWAASNDQKRVMSPLKAINAGANIIVIGRPVIQADDPVDAVERLFEE